MNLKDEIWILADDRPGTVSQSIGLAEELGFDYKIIKLDYSFFSKLPNCFLQSSLLRVSSDLRKKFKNLDYLPSLVISAGRRSAPIALFLKKLSKNQTKIVQIMRPNLSLEKFDFVILPKHDEVDETQFSNVITSIGSLTKTDENLIAREQEKFSSWFYEITKTKIAVLLGGASDKTKFEKNSVEKLAEISSKIANEMDATLLVLNSRRTSDELTEAMKLGLKCDFKFFDWAEIKNENPYLAILGFADFFIITGDSVSMISECCSTGKPVFIFDEKEISSPKHRKFHQNLFAENYAKKLLKNANFLENFSSKKLQETKRIAALIRAKF
ncbi:MAG: mitochondrial fission ELM1 family protein [Rickettsiales bacterium]|nr:mitochondrial fission ELM1 family protein [Rickettsiales bacterium]